MNYKILSILCLLFIGLLCISNVSAHGADITEDTMIIANESNGVLAKDIVDNLGLDITVYKFKSADDVNHQLEHALSNPNKRILAIAYTDTVNRYLDKHPDLKNRILTSADDNNSIEISAKNLVSIETGSSNENYGFITPLIVGLIIGVFIGLVGGVTIMKRKN